MQASFTGINVATRGLYASQAGLAVTTNNASNADTEGYTRQTVTQTSMTPAASYSGNAVLGNGVTVTAIDQERDALLDQRYWKENTRLGEWETKAATLTEVEEIMNNATSSAGFSSIFDEFSSSLETLATDPSDTAALESVQQYGEAVCSYLNDTASRLTDIQSDLNASVRTTVDQINAYAEQIADLNQRITEVVAASGNANELKDQRNLLVDSLTELTGCTVTASDDDSGTLTVQLGSATLVDGERCNKLEAVEDSANNNLYTVKWENTGETATISGGSLEAYLDLRDGDGSDPDYNGIPYYLSQLDKFAQTLAQAINEGTLADTSVTTYSGTADGYNANGTTGIRFFTYTNASGDAVSSADFVSAGLDYTAITAANISLSADVAADAGNIATSGGTAYETENSDIVDNLIDMLQDTAMFDKGTPGDYYNSIISTLATDSASAQRREDNYTSIVNLISDRRTSVSGVDTNEETAYMMQYQSAYEASAKMVSMWSEVLATTIDMVNSD